MTTPQGSSRTARDTNRYKLLFYCHIHHRQYKCRHTGPTGHTEVVLNREICSNHFLKVVAHHFIIGALFSHASIDEIKFIEED